MGLSATPGDDLSPGGHPEPPAGMIRTRLRTIDRRVMIALAAASCATWLVVQFAVHPHLLDLSVYRSEGFALRRGLDLYGPIGAPYDLRATYPPFAALAFVVLTLLPLGVWSLLVTLANLGLIVVIVRCTARTLRRDGFTVDPVLVPFVVAGAIWLEPVSTSLHYGQINLLILALIMGDFAAGPTRRWRGLGVGVAIGLKVVPALFVLYLVLTRRFRFALTAVGGFALTVAISYGASPALTLRYWSSLVFQPLRAGDIMGPENQSLAGAVTRALGRPDLGVAEPALTASVVAIGLWCSVRVYQRCGETWGLCTAAVTALLASPISWSHHWVWCVPIAMLLLMAGRDLGRPARLAAGGSFLVFYSYVGTSGPKLSGRDVDLGVGRQLLDMPYPLLGAAFLALAVSPFAVPARSPIDGSAPALA